VIQGFFVDFGGPMGKAEALIKETGTILTGNTPSIANRGAIAPSSHLARAHPFSRRLQ
jgi:hypothetical protein